VLFIHRLGVEPDMAARRTDSFFIRKTVALVKDGTFYQDNIDLGAFVDALGEAVLRIHNIALTFSDGTGNALQVLAASDSAAAQFQLTTQSHLDTVRVDDKSVIATGIVYAVNQFSSDEFPQLSHDMDVMPQLWSQGYLVAVEQLYLGGEASSGWGENVYVSIVMECTSEKMTKAAGLALALSQQ